MGGRDDGEVDDDQAYFLRGEWSPRQLESFNQAWEADMERYAAFLKKLADELAEFIKSGGSSLEQDESPMHWECGDSGNEFVRLTVDEPWPGPLPGA